MKTLLSISIFFKSLRLLDVLFCLVQEAHAQMDIDSPRPTSLLKNDGTQFVGEILSIDEREVLLQTPVIGMTQAGDG